MGNKLYILLMGAITIACGSSNRADAASSTAACHRKLGGNWEFGRAPYGCAISDEQARALSGKYLDLTYGDAKQKTEESPRFATSMYHFLMEYSTAYLKRREPNVTPADVANWNRLVLSIAHQESFWTQYRLGKDNVFRFFRGDHGHGYGLMQVDDRWNKRFISSGEVFDLHKHFVYALDEVYRNRSRIKAKPCGGLTDVDSVNRSVFSAYNGGPASKCRWTNPGHRWSRNDKNFHQKYVDRAWEKVVRN